MTNEFSYMFSYMPIMHCDTCGTDWIPIDEKDIHCPAERKLIESFFQFCDFRRMCAEYMGLQIE